MSETPDTLKLRATDPLKLPLATGWGSMAQDGEVLILPRTATIFSIRGGELGAADVVDPKGPASLVQVKYQGIMCKDGDYLASYCIKLTPDQIVEAVRAHLRHANEVQRHNDGVIREARRLAKQDRMKNAAKDVLDAEFGEDADMDDDLSRLAAARPALRRRRPEVHTRAHIDEGEVMMELAAREDW